MQEDQYHSHRAALLRVGEHSLCHRILCSHPSIVQLTFRPAYTLIPPYMLRPHQRKVQRRSRFSAEPRSNNSDHAIVCHNDMESSRQSINISADVQEGDTGAAQLPIEIEGILGRHRRLFSHRIRHGVGDETQTGEKHISLRNCAKRRLLVVK